MQNGLQKNNHGYWQRNNIYLWNISLGSSTPHKDKEFKVHYNWSSWQHCVRVSLQNARMRFALLNLADAMVFRYSDLNFSEPELSLF